jgi:hypothetical protein
VGVEAAREEGCFCFPLLEEEEEEEEEEAPMVVLLRARGRRGVSRRERHQSTSSHMTRDTHDDKSKFDALAAWTKVRGSFELNTVRSIHADTNTSKVSTVRWAIKSND